MTPSKIVTKPFEHSRFGMVLAMWMQWNLSGQLVSLVDGSVKDELLPLPASINHSDSAVLIAQFNNHLIGTFLLFVECESLVFQRDLPSYRRYRCSILH